MERTIHDELAQWPFGLPARPGDSVGRPMESVSGGGHWGGGMFISSFDHARLGLLVQRRGRWGGGRQLLPDAWVAEMLAPSAANPSYGYLWWLNTDGALFPSASPGSVFALGAGGHVVWVDDRYGLLVVARWLDRAHCDGLIARILASVA